MAASICYEFKKKKKKLIYINGMDPRDKIM